MYLFGRIEAGEGALDDAPTRLGVDEAYAGIWAGDMDGDGLDDVLAEGSDAAWVFTAIGEGDREIASAAGSYAGTDLIPFDAGWSRAGDLDGDGRGELWAGSWEVPGVYLLNLESSGPDDALAAVWTPDEIQRIWGADLDGDGVPELLAEVEGALLGWNEPAVGVFGDIAPDLQVAVSALDAVGVADLDGDGLAELAIGDNEGGVESNPEGCA